MSKEFAVNLGASIDTMNAEEFGEHLHDQVVFRFGNQDEVRGRHAVEENVAGFFQAIRSIRHEVLRVHEAGDFLIVEMKVSYVDQWGRDLAVPVCNVLKLDDGLVREYLIYIDNHDLFASPEDRLVSGGTVA